MVEKLPDACEAWNDIMPPVAASSSSQKWIVHRVETVYGLGDYLAGVFSAFLIAAATRRRLYIDHPFGDLVSFAPYDISPAPEAWRSARSYQVSENVCPRWRHMIGTEEDAASRVLVYEGKDRLPEDGSLIPANRACAWSWRHDLGPIWQTLGGPLWQEGDFDRFLIEPNLVYGCAMSLFRPSRQIAGLIPPLNGVEAVIGVHVRSGDTSFAEGSTGCATEYIKQQAVEIMSVRDTVNGKVGYRIESDSACVRAFLADYVSRARSDDVVAPLLAPPQHDILEQGLSKQLAAWFALSTVDIFLVSPMYAPMSHDPRYDKYGHCPPRLFHDAARRSLGFADHGYLRLSSWSVMAALRAGTTRIHVICSKAPPNGWDLLHSEHPVESKLIPRYVCDTTIPSTFAIVTDFRRGYSHVNVHFIKPDRLEATRQGTRRLIWGIGNFM